MRSIAFIVAFQAILGALAIQAAQPEDGAVRDLVLQGSPAFEQDLAAGFFVKDFVVTYDGSIFRADFRPSNPTSRRMRSHRLLSFEDGRDPRVIRGCAGDSLLMHHGKLRFFDPDRSQAITLHPVSEAIEEAADATYLHSFRTFGNGKVLAYRGPTDSKAPYRVPSRLRRIMTRSGHSSTKRPPNGRSPRLIARSDDPVIRHLETRNPVGPLHGKG